jgi:hypothetical protein
MIDTYLFLSSWWWWTHDDVSRRMVKVEKILDEVSNSYSIVVKIEGGVNYSANKRNQLNNHEFHS